MLKYKVKLNEPKGYNEIKYDELYLSPDMSFISGVTDYKYGLLDGQHLSLEFNNDNRFHDVVVKIENVTRKGYVILNQIFTIERYKGYNGFFYVDGNYYFSSDNTINVKGKSCTIEDNHIHVDTIYWVEDNKIVIGENEYKVNIQLDKDGKPIYNHYITLKGGKQLLINNCSKDKWKKVTKFYIRKNNDYKLKLEDASCAKKYPYFFYNVDKKTALNDKTKIFEYINKKHYLKFNEKNDKYEVKIGDKTFIQDFGVVKCNDEKYVLEYEWRNTAASNFLHLFLNMPQYNFTSAQKILVESVVPIKTKCDIKFSGETKNNDGYIIYCGKRYNESTDTKDFLIIDEEEYELTYIKKDKSQAYIIFNNTPYLIIINGEEGIKVVQTSENNVFEEKKYKIKKYHYITIENDIFLVKSYTKVDVTNTNETIIEYVDVIRKEKFVLSITDVVNNSMLRCRADVGEDGEEDGICTLISANYKSLTFSLLNPIFEERNILKDSFILASIKGKEDVFDSIKIFNPSNYLKIPLVVGNDMATNVRQEDILENIFFKNEIEKSINPYVDMEREIYYPCYNKQTDDDKKPILSLINEIQFDLHFRSRNLEDWKINDDVFTKMKGEEKKKLKTKYTWNIFDNYANYYPSDNVAFKNKDDEFLMPFIKDSVINNDFKYYQPADLLYFLNFTTDDVFYQKSKISKSFLRLLFFDSNDVANQTLLYSCTVFMNENKLYKTYIDNVVKNDNMYASINEELNDIEVLTSPIISVYNDTCDKDGKVTFEEDKRLAAKFIVKNRYEAEESAEGFYLHIFKDYSEKLHDKTIYMKVEFNHAGEGRTINFTLPFTYDENGNIEMIDLSPSGDVSKFKEGYLLNELYEYMFIPIKVVYDDDNKRYSYYLPNGLAKNSDKEKVMKFNLYELKIKDES